MNLSSALYIVFFINATMAGLMTTIEVYGLAVMFSLTALLWLSLATVETIKESR